MSERERLEVWVSKYALTGGIQRKRAELCSDISEDMISIINGHPNECYHGDDWHRDEAAAIAKAEKMRSTKLASLDKQRAHIAALTFPSQKERA